MKSLTLLFILIGLNFSLFSQSPNTVTKNKDGKLYQVYYVVSGDGWYSIAKKFNTTYAELRLANKTGDDKLNIGRELLIPLSKIKSNDPFFEKNYLDSSSNSTNNKPLFPNYTYGYKNDSKKIALFGNTKGYYTPNISTPV